MIKCRLIMAVLTSACTIAPLTIVWPVLDLIMTGLVIGAVLAGFFGYWLREVRRELLFRWDMRALDVRDANHPPVERTAAPERPAQVVEAA